MKTRILCLLVVIAAIAAFYYTTIRPTLTPAQPSLNRRLIKEFRPPTIPAPELPQPRIEMPSIPLPAPAALRFDDRKPLRMEVPIQDGSTIDFSLGAPMVRSQGEDRAALDKALKEMAEATKDVRFPPPVAPENK